MSDGEIGTMCHSYIVLIQKAITQDHVCHVETALCTLVLLWLCNLTILRIGGGENHRITGMGTASFDCFVDSWW